MSPVFSFPIEEVGEGKTIWQMQAMKQYMREIAAVMGNVPIEPENIHRTSLTKYKYTRESQKGEGSTRKKRDTWV